MDDPQDSAAGPSRAELIFPTALPPLKPTDAFLSQAADYGISFDRGELEHLGRYLALLLASNKLVNLTAIRDPADAWERHIFDSLTLLPVLAELPEQSRIIDVGSGGGLPGIPLAVVLPHLAFTLLDATGKKVAFLQHAVRELALTNVAVFKERAETIGAPGASAAHRGSYDAVIARAVGKVVALAEITVPLAKVNRLIIMIKGQRAEEELAQAKQALHALHTAHVGTIDTATGRIIVLEKRRPTPAKFPRTAAEIQRRPLGL